MIYNNITVYLFRLNNVHQMHISFSERWNRSGENNRWKQTEYIG